jgi:hypothetical protein
MNFEKGSFSMSEDCLESFMEDMTGLCTACGEEYDGRLEPDAHNVKCTSCGEYEASGVEELLLRGKIELEDVE